MSRADGAARFLEAATALGIAGGVSALTMQGIAAEAGVSKALVLYHFDDKRALLQTLVMRLATADAAALRAAADAEDPFAAWLALGSDGTACGARALLCALMLDPAVREIAPDLLAVRERAAAALALAMLGAAELRPRLTPALLGRLLLQQLDGISATARQDAEAALDAFALALLALGEDDEAVSPEGSPG
jgi:AcrR family transcriptional regulator